MSVLLSTTPEGVLSAWSLRCKIRLSSTMASTPLVGKPTRTTNAVAASLAFRRESLKRVLPCSSGASGAFGAVVSLISAKPLVGALVLPAWSVSVTLKL